MMLCYLIGIFIIEAMVIGVVILNTFLLQQQTVDKVESTRDQEANTDLLGLTLAGAEVIYSVMYGGSMSLNVLKTTLSDMYREETFALAYTNLFNFSQIPLDCVTVDQELYGNYSISYNYSTIYSLNLLDEEGIDLSLKVSRFSYIWPNLLQIYSPAAFRYTMYFDTSGFVLFYPGLDIADYSPQDSFWYQQYLQNEGVTVTKSYQDSIGNPENLIISIVSPLVDDNNTNIGALSGDWLLSSLYDVIDNLTYLNSGNKYLVYKDGEILITSTNK